MMTSPALFLTLLIALSPIVALADEWRLAKSGFGIDVEYRYPDNSVWREFRGQVEVSAKPDRVVRFL